MPRYDEPGVRFDDPLIRYDDPRTYAQVLADHQNSQHRKAMYDVVLDISNLSVPELIARGRQIGNATASHPAFAGLAVEIAAVNTACDALEAKQNEITTARALAESKTTERDEEEVPAVFEKLQKLALKVGDTATNEAEVEATTMRVRPKAGPKPVPGQPTGLELTYGDDEGEIAGQCDGQPGVVDYYEIRFTTADPNSSTPNWQLADTSKKSSFEIGGLPSGQKVWVSLRACNARGKSPWSDPACKRVP